VPGCGRSRVLSCGSRAAVLRRLLIVFVSKTPNSRWIGNSHGLDGGRGFHAWIGGNQFGHGGQSISVIQPGSFRPAARCNLLSHFSQPCSLAIRNGKRMA
jgi:hypothetical protein